MPTVIMKEYMKKYQIVSQWNTESALQILEIDSEPKQFPWGAIIFILIVGFVAYSMFGTSHSVSQQVEEQKKELVIPAPILNMKDNPHAAEDLNTLSDL